MSTPDDPPGWGQPPGWGEQSQPPASGWGTPGYRAPPSDAPSPGPVPVRPMGLGELLDGAFKLLRADFGPLLIAVGVVVVPTQVLLTILSANFATDLFTTIEANPQAVDQIFSDIGAAIPGFVLVTLLSIILLLLAEAAVVRIGAARYLGGTESAGDALRAAGRKALPLIGARLLATVGAALLPLLGVVLVAFAFAAGDQTLGGIALLVLLLLVALGVYLYIRWFLTTPAIMLEDAGAAGSLSRSAQLVKGRWWTVFGYLIVAGIVVGLVGIAVSGIFTAIGSAFPADWFGWVFTGLGAIIASLITEPVAALITLLLYADARVRKEGLDLQLRAARSDPWLGAGEWSAGASPG